MLETKVRKPVKKVKGMTLIEIIIAMTVFAIAGTVMVKVGQASKSQLLNSNHLINKTQAEVSVGSSDHAIAKLRDEYGDNYEQAVRFTISYSNAGSTGSDVVNGNRYATLKADEHSGKNCDTGLADDESLKFYKITP